MKTLRVIALVLWTGLMVSVTVLAIFIRLQPKVYENGGRFEVIRGSEVDIDGESPNQKITIEIESCSYSQLTKYDDSNGKNQSVVYTDPASPPHNIECEEYFYGKKITDTGRWFVDHGLASIVVTSDQPINITTIPFAKNSDRIGEIVSIIFLGLGLYLSIILLVKFI
jgi:hypothetical protein